MGAIWWGTRGTCPLTFLDGGDIICHVSPLLCLRVCIWRGFKTKYDVSHLLCEEILTLDHRRNLVGDTGDVSPRLFRWRDIICHVPPLFLFRFCIWRNSKNKSDVGHVLRETLFMLNATYSQVDFETEFGVVSLDSVSLSILASIK